jgi:hypothetical protein
MIGANARTIVEDAEADGGEGNAKRSGMNADAKGNQENRRAVMGIYLF